MNIKIINNKPGIVLKEAVFIDHRDYDDTFYLENVKKQYLIFNNQEISWFYENFLGKMEYWDNYKYWKKAVKNKIIKEIL